jgi:hypothetical protein
MNAPAETARSVVLYKGMQLLALTSFESTRRRGVPWSADLANFGELPPQKKRR